MTKATDIGELVLRVTKEKNRDFDPEHRSFNTELYYIRLIDTVSNNVHDNIQFRKAIPRIKEYIIGSLNKVKENYEKPLKSYVTYMQITAVLSVFPLALDFLEVGILGLGLSAVFGVFAYFKKEDIDKFQDSRVGLRRTAIYQWKQAFETYGVKIQKQTTKYLRKAEPYIPKD